MSFNINFDKNNVGTDFIELRFYSPSTINSGDSDITETGSYLYMSAGSGTNTISIGYQRILGGGTNINNVSVITTSGTVDIHMVKDFFVPSDECYIEIDGTINLNNKGFNPINFWQKGNRVDIFLNGNLNMSGYIFKNRVRDEGNGLGVKVYLEIKDLLELMAQGSIFPNLTSRTSPNGIIPSNNAVSPLVQLQLQQIAKATNGGLTSFHFPSDWTLRTCLESIVYSFSYFMGYQNPPLIGPVQIVVDDNYSGNPTTTSQARGNLTVASGFAAGLRVSGKHPKNLTKSINAAINRLNTPEKGESYLDMMKRLSKMSGAYIKMAPGSNDTIVVQAPVYDRTVETPLQINHFISPNLTYQNNTISAEFQENLDKQYSIIVVEGQTMDEENFHLTDQKAVAINELTGYYVSQQEPQPQLRAMLPVVDDPPQMTPSVSFTVFELCNGNENQSPNGSGYVTVPFNSQLFQQRSGSLPLTSTIQTSFPDYKVSATARTHEQLLFEAHMEMAKVQDEAIQFTYKIAGWTNNGMIWQPNMLVKVIEEKLGTTNPFKLWIRKVQYVKNRHEGTYVIVTCSLPYTHNCELSESTSPPTGPTVPITQSTLVDQINRTAQSLENNAVASGATSFTPPTSTQAPNMTPSPPDNGGSLPDLP